jgi:hypothetical protein
MDNVREMLSYLSYAELSAIGKELADLKRDAKEREKDTLGTNRSNMVKIVNKLIDEGDIVKGTDIIVLYKGNEVEATVNTVPTVAAKNLNLTSDAFETKDRTRYAEKYNFVRIA